MPGRRPQQSLQTAVRPSNVVTTAMITSMVNAFCGISPKSKPMLEHDQLHEWPRVVHQGCPRSRTGCDRKPQGANRRSTPARSCTRSRRSSRMAKPFPVALPVVRPSNVGPKPGVGEKTPAEKNTSNETPDLAAPSVDKTLVAMKQHAGRQIPPKMAKMPSL